MGYIKGESLKDVIAVKGKLSLTDVLKISEDVLSALECIHCQDLVHRDIKPANIMIEKESGRSIIIDFGIAKDLTLTSSLTMSGIGFGTPFYMAPEQCIDSSRVSQKTDIYSFGVVVYEMLTGEVPFKGQNGIEICECHKKKSVPNVRDKNPALRVGIEDIIFKAMKKKPKDRYDNAGDFLNALRKIDKKPPGTEIRYIISLIAVVIIVAFIFLKSAIPEWQYGRYISSAKTLIELRDWGKADDALEKAKKIKDTPEIERLLAEIMEQRVVAMKADFDDLKAFLKGKSSNKDKLQKCREFLAKQESIPGNVEKTAIVSEVNLSISNLEAAVKLDEAYQNLIKAATEFIKKGDYLKAVESLEKARNNRGTDTTELAALSKEIEEKQIKAMRDDFEILKKFLASSATNKEKLGKCQAFLTKHKNTPMVRGTLTMRDEINRFISILNTGIKGDKQYQKYIDAVNKLINSKDYEGAEKELNKARKIQNSDEVKRLSAVITKGLETERINGEKEFKSIKDKLTLIQYLAFKRKYPQSAHLQELRDRLKTEDKNLPPEKYWDKPIRKNEKSYYEITFGREHNGHQMIYIPGKKIWIDKYEVSWAQFRKYLKDAKRPIPSKESNEYINDGDGFPAVVTFGEAERYCKRYDFQLPKKEEWEYAAGKGNLIYPWGNESPGVPNYRGQWRANLDTLDGDKDKDGYKGTAAVKSFEPFSSPFGVVNMAGNVWEWIQGKVLKGGGYLSLEDDLRIGNIRQPEPLDKEGFRCMKVEN